MVTNLSLNCTTLNPRMSYNQKLSFGNEEKAEVPEEKADSVQITSKNEEQNEVALQSDRKFSVKNAGNQFFQGIVSPLKALAKSPVSLATAAVAGWAMSEISKKSKHFGTIMIALTSGIGVFGIGKGVVGVAKGKTAQAKEESFKDIGKGTVTVGLAALFSKPALKSNPDLVTKKPLNDMNPLESLVTCWKQTPKIMKNIFNKGFSEGMGFTKSSVMLTADGSSMVADHSNTSGAGDILSHTGLDMSSAPADVKNVLNSSTATVAATSAKSNGIKVNDKILKESES